MATIELSFHDNLNLGSPVKYDQGFYYDDPRLTYDCTLESDSVSKQVSVVKSDSMSFSELISKSFSKPFSDSLSFSDTTAKSFSTVVADTISFTDDFSRVVDFKRSFSETLELSDVLSKRVNKTLSDSLSFSDSVLKQVEKYFYDDIEFIDSYSKAAEYFREFSDTIEFSDRIVSKDFFLVVSDAIEFSDAVTKSFGLVVSDSLIFTDLVHVGIPLRRSVLDVGIVHVGLDLDSVSVEGLDAVLPKYDASFLYDQEGLYYDKLYSPTDNFSQGERGGLSAKPAIVGVDTKKTTVEVIAKSPIVAVIADEDSIR